DHGIHRRLGVDDAGATTAGAGARQRPRGRLDDRLHLGRGQRGSGHRLHQRDDAGHVRGRHRGAVVVGIALAARGGAAGVDGGGDLHARRGDVDQRAVVGEAGARSALVGGRHGDHVLAVGRHRGGHVGIAVAGGHHDGGATGDSAVDRVLVGAGAGTATAQGEVDHVSRGRVGGHAADAATRGPGDGVDDVGGVTTAATQHAHRLHLGARRGAGDALGIVGHRRDGAGDVGAVPAGRIAAVVVARIGRVGVAAVAVTGDRAVADEVVAGDDVGVEVAVVGDAGIQHRHHDAAAGGHVPGLVGADAAGGVEVAPLHAVMGVVGGEDGLHQLVDLDVLD